MNGTYQELFGLLPRRHVIETTGMNDPVVDIKLIPSPLVHGFSNTLLGNRPENKDSLGLTDTMRTVMSLKVGVRVPIEVEAAWHQRLAQVYNEDRIGTHMMTVSAVYKSRPRLPAPVERGNTLYSESFWLKSCTKEAPSSLLCLCSTIQTKVLPTHHLQKSSP